MLQRPIISALALSLSLAGCRLDGEAAFARDYVDDYESDLEEAQLKHQVARASRVVVGIADSSKLGARSFSAFALPHEIDRIITDTAAPSDLIAALRAHEIQVDLV